MANWFKLQTWKDLIARVKARFTKKVPVDPLTAPINDVEPPGQSKKMSVKTQGRKSIKLDRNSQTKLQKAADDLRDHYGDLLSSWSQLSPTARDKVLSSFPILSDLKNLTEPLRG